MTLPVILDASGNPISTADRGRMRTGAYGDTRHNAASQDRELRRWKAARRIEKSMRCVEVSFVVPFEDVVDMHTGYVAHVDADDTLIPGGWAEGKVTRFQVSDPDLSSVPLATITFRAIPGTGAAANVGAAGGIGYTDQPWDMISLDEVSGAGAQPFPAVGCQKAVAINGADGQATYIAANDYQRGLAGRSDKTANDPKSLVKQVKTTIGMYLTDVSGKKDMTSVININTGGYNGPRQIVLPGQS